MLGEWLGDRIFNQEVAGSKPRVAVNYSNLSDDRFVIKLSVCRFDRRIENMCGISNWLAYPKLKKTGDDSDDVTPTS